MTERKQPIDLQALAGKRYRIAHDHKPDVRASDDPWLLTIPGRLGHIYPHSDKLLGVATNGRGTTASALRKLCGVTVVQDGDDGINATFPRSLFSKVVALIKARRRRQLSPERKAKLVSAGAATQLRPKHGVQSAFKPQIPALAA